MAIHEETVARVVTDISEQMREPAYGQLAVGGFVEEQPDAARYISSQSKTLGGGEAVVQAVFHAHLLVRCFEQSTGHTLLPIHFRELDTAAKLGDPWARLQRAEPALADYLNANLDSLEARKVLSIVALALAKATPARKR